MTYNEWLDCIEELKNSNNYLILDKLEKEDVNENINSMLEPKLLELIDYKFRSGVSNIVVNLKDMYSDQYYMDLLLLNFKKDIIFIKKLLRLKQISNESSLELENKLKDDLEDSYKILEEESVKVDDTGNLLMIIRNNKIKWSD